MLCYNLKKLMVLHTFNGLQDLMVGREKTLHLLPKILTSYAKLD
jgi:hypothetical protein